MLVQSGGQLKLWQLLPDGLERVTLTVQLVIMTADQIINMIPLDLGVSEPARLRNLLVSRDARGARRYAHAAAIRSILFGIMLFTVLTTTRNIFGRLFDDDELVMELFSRILPHVALFQVADGINRSFDRALRGMERQWVGALVNFVSYYTGAFPGGIYLAFHE